jgi:hypothetical protein
MHCHKCGLLGNIKLTNQVVADVREPGNCLKVIPDALIEVFLHQVHLVRALLAHNVGPLGETNVLKTLAYQAEQCWTIFLLDLGKSSDNLLLEVQKREHNEILGSKSCLVRRDVSCVFLVSFFKENLDAIGLFQAFFDQLVQ